ncbi:glycosyltransferase [Burkholderia gladioli]|jgi:glycosyltransferase involved in cell wall biosynthesis|uniref:glycosyltransferase n=1 Tax=Burkholderia gladioli TaxID=28095 RepID=UPI00164183B8|nr:glycosyltransferase [Burkholderia gladioli]MDN7718693.1 glycosyltransferase [Burkholderia gladioli]
MQFNTSFSGRIIQVTEALDFGDAVSNNVIALDDLFKRSGFEASIHSKWFSEKVANYRSDLDELRLTEKDVVIYHFYGYAEHSLKLLADQYCTKILVYHNVTPHDFFEKESKLYRFCRQGREQLREMLDRFHYFWADSEFNLSELRALGADPDACSVVPIIVPAYAGEVKPGGREAGAWLFLGRIAPNKNQIELVKLFKRMRAINPLYAQKLYIAGGYEHDEPYFKALLDEIEAGNMRDLIQLTGKISDQQRDALFSKASLYVSLSEHEGFGVPLVEAPLRGLPVVALNTTAIGETMGGKPGLAHDLQDVQDHIARFMRDDMARASALEAQRLNAARFLPDAVARLMLAALRPVLPARRQYRTVSVVICTYNRRDYLERCLDYLRHQTCSDFEVIVVNGPSDDGTQDVLDRHADRIKIAQNPKRNLSVSRNIGIELADGDVIAFIDDDAIPFDDWIENLLREYNGRPMTTAGLGGPAYYAGSFWFQAQDNGINKYANAKVNIDSAEIGRDGWYRYNTGTNATFSSRHLRAANGFDEQFDYYLDESELCFRLQAQGKLIGYSDDVIVRHEFAQSHNREGKYKYNWETICKNTAYFIAAYSGLSNTELRDYVSDRMQVERIEPLDAAVKAGELDAVERDQYVQAIHKGIGIGLKDALAFPKTRRLSPPPEAFQPYGIEVDYPRCGLDVKRLHICIVTREFPPFAGNGGVGTLYYHLASELLLMGHEVSIITPSGEDKLHRQGRFSIYFSKIQPEAWVDGLDKGFTTNLQWSLSALHALSELHRQRPIDVVDSALWDSESLAFSLVPAGSRPPLVLRLVTPFPVTSRINGWSVPERVTELFVEAERSLLRHADAVIPISESIAGTVEKEHGVERDARWKMAHCGIAYWPFFDVNLGYSAFEGLRDLPDGELESSKLVVFVGRLERRKGIDLLVEAAQRILESDPKARLLIAGRDPEGWQHRAVEMVSADARKRLHFLGEVADATRDKILARAHCLVFPSRYESFGLVPLEAFVHGVPVIASRSGAIPEVVADGKCGLLFDPDRSASLAEKVVRVLNEPGLRDRLSVGARAQIRRFSSRNSAAQAIRVYANLIGACDETRPAEVAF